MKKIILLVFLALSYNGFAQILTPAPSPLSTVTQAVGLSNVNLEFSRPSLKGRKIFGTTLVPYGQVWRTGANKIPNIIISKDMLIEGKAINAGTYGLLTIPGLKTWTIIITKNANQWGSYDYKETEDLLRFTVPATLVKEKSEHFSMGFTDFTSTSAKVFITWENTQVKFKMSHDPHAEILKQIDEKTAGDNVDTDTYFTAAEYYADHGLDLNKALGWANKVVDKDKQYWTYNLRGKIAAKLGQCQLAKSDATLGLELAKKGNDPAYITKLNDIIKSCSK